jgi:ActR/RegA family two-component response regulator/GGDEF domain-containing protein
MSVSQLSPSGAPGARGLRVIGIVGEADTGELMGRVFARSGDELELATDLAEGLARTASDPYDVAFVDVSMGKNAGLALVHHLRAVSGDVAVYALVGPAGLELGTQAVALGASGVLFLPLNGDDLLTAVGDVRARREERRARRRLEQEAAALRMGASLAQQVAAIAEARDRAAAAERVAAVLAEVRGADAVLVYLPAAEGSRQLMRAATRGVLEDAPTFCEEMELLEWARRAHLDVVPLVLEKRRVGLAMVGGKPATREQQSLLGVVAAQAATTLALVDEREQSHRGQMKDPGSSAYTFAYFVDIAGREIDKARRHSRRFALATVGVLHEDSRAPAEAEAAPAAGVEIVERVLGAVRDTDVLARVDEAEFYLLLPETGGTGAHTCRRRIMRHLGALGGRRGPAADGTDVTIGVATFPHNGTDLSRLLRVAKHRADAMRASSVRRLGLDKLPLPEVLEALFWSTHATDGSRGGLETLHVIELPLMDAMAVALTAVEEALRGGAVEIAATQRPGVCTATAVRSLLGREREDVVFHALDATGSAEHRELEALTVIAEHACYVMLGRVDRSTMRAIHSADPLLADLVTQRLGEAAGVRLGD